VRPLAAALVADAQSHESARPGFGHIGSCCAKSDVPILPEPRRSQASPPVSPTHRTWASFNSTNTPTTRLQEVERRTAMTNLFLSTTIRTQSTHSRVDSAQHEQMYGRGSYEGTPIFQAPLTSESFRVLESSASPEESLSCARLLRLYEMVETDLYRTTRRLAFLLGENHDLVEEQEFWMPLCDIAVVRREARVIISWSDCNHRVSHETVNGITPHSRVYRRQDPNNTLLINFVTEAKARDFATQISEPRIPKTDLIRWPVNLSPYAISGAWGFDTAGNYHKYSVSPEVMYNVQAFDCHAVKNHEPSRGLLVRARDDLTTSTSRIYWLPRTIDIMLALDSGSKPSVSLMDVLAAGYKSNIRRVHNSGIDQVGVCEDVEPSACSVSLRFETPHGKYHLRRNIWAQVLIFLQRGTTFSMALPDGLCDNVHR
jgi:hypothetical protein